MLLGLLRYFVLSPFTTEAMRDFCAAMKSLLRFFAVEHVSLMLAAVVIVHVGRVLPEGHGGGRRSDADLFRPGDQLHDSGDPWPAWQQGGRCSLLDATRFLLRRVDHKQMNRARIPAGDLDPAPRSLARDLPRHAADDDLVGLCAVGVAESQTGTNA